SGAGPPPPTAPAPHMDQRPLRQPRRPAQPFLALNPLRRQTTLRRRPGLGRPAAVDPARVLPTEGPVPTPLILISTAGLRWRPASCLVGRRCRAHERTHEV